uniref:RRM domain-containing protein n=1 Tax=Panagrolaimus sp. ES5 TaxID=591445 RepID=A0AC34GTG0_9BILA
MSSRVYIGNLSSRASERDVEDFFRGYGKIRDVILKSGFGFVEFDDSRDAADAVEDLNGRDLCGDRVKIELSRRNGREDRGGGRRDDRGGGRQSKREKYGPPVQTRYRLLVDNLSTRCSWQDLKDLMRQVGDVTYADAHKKEPNHAVVCFTSASDLKRAIDKFQGKDINGRRIKLTDDSQPGGGSARGGGGRESRSRSPRSRSPRSKSRSRSPRSASRSRTRSPPPPSKSRSRSGSPVDEK